MHNAEFDNAVRTKRSRLINDRFIIIQLTDFACSDSLIGQS